MRALAALFFFTLSALADDPIVIKVKLHPDVGQTRTTIETSKDTGSIKFEGPDGKTAEVKPGGSETVVRDTILETDPEGKPTRFLRVHEKATRTHDGETKTLSHQGKTMLYETGTDGKFRIGVAGDAEVDPKDVQLLYDKADRPTDFQAILKQLTSGKPVRIGDSWKLAVKPTAEALAANLDEAKSSTTVKLTAVAVRDKARVGTFEINQRLVVKGLKDVGVEVTFDPPAEYNSNGTFEVVIDGTRTEYTGRGKGGFKGKGSIGRPGEAVAVQIETSGDGNSQDSTGEPAKDTKVPAVTWLARPGE